MVKIKLNCVISIKTLILYIEKMYGGSYLSWAFILLWPLQWSSDLLCNIMMLKVGRTVGVLRGRHGHMDFGLGRYFLQHRNQEAHQ